ncbi:hypothetical protein ACKWTF_015816 [Chironomus riparius]
MNFLLIFVVILATLTSDVFGGTGCTAKINLAAQLSDFIQHEYINYIIANSNHHTGALIAGIGNEANNLLTNMPSMSVSDSMLLSTLDDGSPFTAACLYDYFLGRANE